MPTDRVEGYQLSPQQERVFRLSGEAGESPFGVHAAILVEGPSDPSRLRAALEDVVRRHEILRTGFRSLRGMTIPLQVVTESPPQWTDGHDWSRLSEAEREERAARMLAPSSCGWDLESGRVLLADLVTLAPGERLLFLHLPALCADVSTPQSLLREISRSYARAGQWAAAEEAGVESVQYADFSDWQRRLLEKEDPRAARFFRRQKLRDVPAPRLPLEKTRGAEMGYSPEHVLATGRPPWIERMEALARRNGASEAAFLLACFQVLLFRLTGEADVVVGVGADGRSHEELKGVLGLLGQYPPVRTRLDAGIPFLEVLSRAQKDLEAARGFQEFFDWKEVRILDRPADALPCWPFGFDFLDTRASHAVEEVKFTLLQQRARVDRFHARLAVIRGPRGSTVELDYNGRLLSSEAAERLLRQFQNLADQASSAPERPIGLLEILGPDEHRQLLELGRSVGNGTEERFVHELFEEQADLTPDSIALEAPLLSLTYGELRRRANRLARRLRSLGLGQGACVAICLERSTAMVVALLGALKAGAFYLPLDPRHPADRLRFMLENARAHLVLTRPGLLDGFDRLGLRILTDVEGEASEGDPAPDGDAAIDPLDLAYVLYTSGSTGTPKGVMIPHQGLSHYLRWCLERYGASPGDRVALHSPLGFDLSVTSLFTPLATGAALTLVDEGSEIDALAELIGGPVGFRFLKLTPAHLEALEPLLSSAEAVRKPGTLILGGEALAPGIVARLRLYAPALRVINEYGPTEATVGCCLYEIPPELALEGDVPIGRPIRGSEAQVLDRELLPVPMGVSGELYVGGPGLARGYADRAPATAEKFIPHPYPGAPGARLYATGDRARWRADGELDFLGRTDGQIKLRGFRIELGEIESVLRSHPWVEQAVVAAPETANDAKRLVAYVVPRANTSAFSVPAVRKFLESRLPDYMIPSAFVRLDALPLTPNGKVDRRALPAPSESAARTRAPFVAPTTSIEKDLARLWSEVLGIAPIGIRDNFFELGGDSILVIQVVAKARRLHLALTPLDMFEHQTIERLTRVIRATEGAARAEQDLIAGPVPLSPIQRWFFDLDWSDPHHFHQALFLQIPRELDPARLRASFRALLSHHDVLRLRFERRAEGWRQEIAGLEAAQSRRFFTHIDLAALPEESEKAALEAAAAGMHRGLHLTKGPLLQAALFSRRQGPSRLMIQVHHLAVDGVSWSLLTEDLMLAYEQLHRGRPVELPPKTTSFQRWSERLSEYGRSSPELAEELGFWESMAEQASAPLPLDRSEGPNDFASADVVETFLSAEETRALLRDTPKAYRTQTLDLLLTALATAFTEWTGERSLLVDLEGHGRENLFEDLDVTRTVGWFTTLSPVRLQLDASTLAGDAVKSVKQQLRRVPRRGIGFGLLVHFHPDENRRRRLRAALSPEVCFNYLGQSGSARPTTSPYGVAPESRGRLESPRGLRGHLIDINGGVTEGRLQMRWRYSRNRHDRATMEKLSAEFTRALRELIAHCQSADSGGATTTDFPLAGIDQKTLDRLVGNGREIEDLYPLSPTQQGLLFHTLYAPRSAVYFEQVSVRLDGELDVDAFREAWGRVVDRHAVLRTSFAWEDLEEPLSVVRREVELPWVQQDWRGAPEAENRRRLEAFLEEDRRKGFDLKSAPLMRLAMLRVEEEGSYLVWSHHHLLLDGWSVPLLLKEVLLALEGLRLGRELAPEPSRPYRDFISWLKGQDKERAERFWRARLAGFRTPTTLPAAVAGARGLRDEVNYERRDRAIPAATTSLLQARGREHHVSLNTWIQGAWAVILAERSGQNDVLFGVTSTGRPVSLSGFESMVGMFVTTLPARFDVSAGQDLLPWLQSTQRLQAEGREYEYASLLEIQRWSDLPAGIPLFETQQVFENYPVDSDVTLGVVSRLRISEHRAFTRSSYPITLVSSLAGEQLALKVLFDTDRFDGSAIEALLDDLAALLTRMAEDPHLQLGELGTLVGERSRLRQRKTEEELSGASLRILNRARREPIPYRKGD